jgi:hypothetical protein
MEQWHVVQGNMTVHYANCPTTDDTTAALQATCAPDTAADAVQGELLKLSQLPPPWGPKPYKPSPETVASYQPPAYPQASAPSITA